MRFWVLHYPSFYVPQYGQRTIHLPSTLPKIKLTPASAIIFSRTLTVSGKITDETGGGIAGANILEKHHQRYTFRR